MLGEKLVCGCIRVCGGHDESSGLSIVTWLSERKENCLRIADTKTSRERLGWLEDAKCFQIAIDKIKECE